MIATMSLAPPAVAAPSVPSRHFAGVDYPFYKRIGNDDLRAMRRARVRSVRMPLYWHQAEPHRGAFDWTAPDAIVGSLASQGIRTQLIPHDAPLWANGRTAGGIGLDGQTQTTPPLGSPEARLAWQDFVTRAVERYGRGGSFWSHEYTAAYPGAAPLPVQIWQVWNEPNIPGQFDGGPDPTRYAELLRISSDAIRAADPKAVVALAGLPGNVNFSGWSFLDRLYQMPGLKRDFDLVAVHPYAPNLPDLRAEMRQFRDVMLDHHDRHTGIWVSEIGWGSAAPDGNLNKGLKGQASYVTRAFHLFVSHRRQWGVVRLSWFSWRDPPSAKGLCGWCAVAGLFDSSGHAKPAFKAYRLAVRGLDGLVSRRR